MGTRRVPRRTIGGAKRDRTADLLHAMQALSQLSYSPTASAELYGSVAPLAIRYARLEHSGRIREIWRSEIFRYHRLPFEGAAPCLCPIRPQPRMYRWQSASFSSPARAADSATCFRARARRTAQ